MDKGRILLGLCIALMGYILLSNGLSQILLAITVLVIAFLAITLMFKDYLPRNFRLHLDNIVNGIDVSWLVLGLGTFGTGIKFIQNPFRAEPLVWLGLLFTLIAALFIGRSIGKNAHDMINANAWVSVGFGGSFIVLAVVVFITTWNSIVARPAAGVSVPMFFAGMGIIFVIYGIKRLKAIAAARVPQ